MAENTENQNVEQVDNKNVQADVKPEETIEIPRVEISKVYSWLTPKQYKFCNEQLNLLYAFQEQGITDEDDESIEQAKKIKELKHRHKISIFAFMAVAFISLLIFLLGLVSNNIPSGLVWTCVTITILCDLVILYSTIIQKLFYSLPLTLLELEDYQSQKMKKMKKRNKAKN